MPELITKQDAVEEYEPRFHIEQALGRTENFIRGIESGGRRGGHMWVMLDAIRTDLKLAIERMELNA